MANSAFGFAVGSSIYKGSFAATSTQAITNGGFRLVALDSIVQETGPASFSNASDNVAVPYTGWYRVAAGVNVNTTPRVVLDIFVNAASAKRLCDLTGCRGGSGSCALYLTAGDTVDVRIFTDADTTAQGDANKNLVWLTVHYLAA